MITFLDKPNDIIFSKDTIAYTIHVSSEKYAIMEVFLAEANINIGSTETGQPDEKGQMSFSVNNMIDAFLEQTISFDQNEIKTWITKLPEKQDSGLKYHIGDGRNAFFEMFKISFKSYNEDGSIADTKEENLTVFLGSSDNQARQFFANPITLLTNQPISKQLTPQQPEIIYLHSEADAMLELQINVILKNGEALKWEFLEIDIQGKNKIIALAIGYQDLLKIAEKKGNDTLEKVSNPNAIKSYSVEWRTGNVKARTQQYTLQQPTRYQRLFLFWESAGAWALLAANGRQKTKLKTNQNTATRYEFLGRGSTVFNYTKTNPIEEHTLDIGFKNRETRQWLRSFLESHLRFAWLNQGKEQEALQPIVVTSNSYKDMGQDETAPKSIQFTYRQAKQPPLYINQAALEENTQVFAVIKLRATAQDHTTVNLNWTSTYPENPLVTFEVWRGVSLDNLQKIGSGQGIATYTDTTVAPETTYYYQIRFNYNSVEIHSNYSITTTSVAPPALANVSFDSSRLTWAPGIVNSNPRLTFINWSSNLVDNALATDQVRIEIEREDGFIFHQWTGLRGESTVNMDMKYTISGPFGEQAKWANDIAGKTFIIRYFTIQDHPIFGENGRSETTTLTVTIPNI